MVERWPLISCETLSEYKIFKVDKKMRRSPRTGKDLGFFVLDTWDWVNVVALTDADELVCIHQYRQGADRVTLEIPGGAVEPDEDALAAGIRELREETGYAAGDARLIGSANPNPAIFTNQCATVLATGCRLVGEIQPDPGEDIDVLTLSIPDFLQAIRDDEVDHALVLAALLWAELDPEVGGFLRRAQ
jgi:ADP-ribose diphosphatase